MTLDLQQPEGRELLARLADGADFLIESSPPGYLDRLGLSYQALAARNPRLIYTSVTPFGDRGPGARPGAPPTSSAGPRAG